MRIFPPSMCWTVIIQQQFVLRIRHHENVFKSNKYLDHYQLKIWNHRWSRSTAVWLFTLHCNKLDGNAGDSWQLHFHTGLGRNSNLWHETHNRGLNTKNDNCLSCKTYKQLYKNNIIFSWAIGVLAPPRTTHPQAFLFCGPLPFFWGDVNRRTMPQCYWLLREIETEKFHSFWPGMISSVTAQPPITCLLSSTQTLSPAFCK